MSTTVEPERELVRRLLPWTAPAVVVAATAAAILGGPHAAFSAAIAIVALGVNLLASAASLSWASRISSAAVLLVGVGGYVLRIATFGVMLLVLDRLPWFSATAFVAAFVPATVALLAIELRLLGGPIQADLWYFRERA